MMMKLSTLKTSSINWHHSSVGLMFLEHIYFNFIKNNKLLIWLVYQYLLYLTFFKRLDVDIYCSLATLDLAYFIPMCSVYSSFKFMAVYSNVLSSWMFIHLYGLHLNCLNNRSGVTCK